MNRLKITVTSTAAVYCGDWHDKPLRWKATGPGDEVQLFSTKRDATAYASIRRKSANFQTASAAFVAKL